MNIAWFKFLIFLVAINLVWATLAFVLAAYLSSIEKLGVAWCRVIFPLWFLGGFQFSWMTTYAVAPTLAYVMLFNPVIYATDGIRAVILGQDGYLPFWICLMIMIALCGIIGWWSVKALRQRLDFV
jgi:ABC-2 type transport system permease protein